MVGDWRPTGERVNQVGARTVHWALDPEVTYNAQASYCGPPGPS